MWKALVIWNKCYICLILEAGQEHPCATYMGEYGASLVSSCLDVKVKKSCSGGCLYSYVKCVLVFFFCMLIYPYL